MANIAVLPKSHKQGAVFESTHVQKVYDEIASSVNDIQHKAWPNVKRFLKRLEPGSLVADIGCGNGRYLGINKSTYKIGVDVCCPLVDNSRSKGYEVMYADNLHIPYRDGMFDGVVSIGVIHHFCSSDRRLSAVRELARILRPGGKLMLYVWAYEQKHRKFDSQDVLIPWHEGLREIRRTGSTSSRHSSIGGMSSTSSVSEEDSLEQFYQPKDGAIRFESPKLLRQQNSVSLDDLTSITEQLSNFKPSYYSLDFNGSPMHKQNIKGNVTADLNSNIEYFEEKVSLVSECRKFEASLRAMSTGNMDDLKKKCQRDIANETKTEILHGSLQDLKIGSLDFLGSNMKDSGIEDAKDATDEIDIVCEHISEESLNETSEQNHIDDVESTDIFHEEQNHIDDVESTDIFHEEGDMAGSNQYFPKSPQINPFLKQSSLDSYTFNKVLSNSTLSGAERESLEEIPEIKTEDDFQDEVFVNFKPDIKSKSNARTTEKSSIFSSVKSKFLKLFDDQPEQLKTRSKSIFEKPTYPPDLSILPKSLSYTALTPEEEHMAAKLNFKVREFPQSSCLGSEEDLSMPSMPKTDKIAHNIAKKIDSPIKYYSKNGTCALQRQNQKNGHCVSPSNCQEHVRNCVAQMKDESIDVLVDHSGQEAIYDGYIKINLDQLNMSALPAVKKAKTQVANTGKDGCICDKASDLPTANEYDEIMCNIAVNERNPGHSGGEMCNIDNEHNHTDKYSDVNDTHHGRTDIDNAAVANGGLNSEHLQSKTDVTEKLNGLMEADVTFDTDSISEADDAFASKLCRYYHVFREGELESLITSHVTDLHIVQCFYDHANWCVVAEKI